MSKIEPSGRPPLQQPTTSEPLRQSPEAIQAQSEGPKLGFAAKAKLLFIWVFTLSFVSATFEKWTAKKTLATSLAKNLIDKMPSGMNKDLLAKQQKILEAQFLTMTTEQLKNISWINDEHNIETRFVDAQHKQTLVGFYITQAASKDPKNLAKVLEDVANQKLSVPIFERYSSNNMKKMQRDDLYTSLQQAFANPQAESTIVEKSTDKQIATVEEILHHLQAGHVYKNEKELSLFPQNPAILSHLGKIPPQNIQMSKAIIELQLSLTQKNLSVYKRSETRQKLQDAKRPKINLLKDKSGGSVSLPCEINCKNITKNSTKSLEVTFSIKKMIFTTYIDYKPNESDEQFCNRIAEDRSLEKALLLATSDFTKQFFEAENK